MEIIFWKTTGGYLTLVKLRGRWRYVGNSSRTTTEMLVEARRRGLTPKRVQQPPSGFPFGTIEKIKAKYPTLKPADWPEDDH